MAAVREERFKANLEELRDVLQWQSVPWLHKADCRKPSAQQGWWFIPGNTGIANHLRDRAREICRACPVRWQCLSAYLEEPAGIFGGFDEKERRHFRETIRSGTISWSYRRSF
jgi:hypothetical protein